MNAPEVNLIRENEREICFAHRPLGGVIVMLIGLGIVYFFSFSPVVKDQAARWIFSAGGALFAVLGFFGALWRYELRLDLLSRFYSATKGFWPGPKTIKGSLDDLEGIVLTSRVVRSNKSTYTVWTASLSFKGMLKTVRIVESRQEIAAHQKMEYYAKKLQIPAIDRTGNEEHQTAWTDLDKPLAEQSDHAVSIPQLPGGSRIEFLDRPGNSRILLPSRGLSFPGIFLVLFGMPFSGMGGTTLLMMFSHSVQGNIIAGAIISFIFVLVGLLIIFLGIAVMWGKQLVEEDGPEIVSSLLLANRRIRPQRIPKREVEEVSLKPIPSLRSSSQQEINIRSDRRIIRVSGAPINQREMEWLKAAVQCLVTR